MTHLYQINLPELIFNTTGDAGRKASEQLLELLWKHDLISRMQSKRSDATAQYASHVSQDLVCDMPHGIFIANSLPDHQQVLNQVERLLKFGLHNMPCFWPSSANASAASHAPTLPATHVSTPAVVLTPPPFMNLEHSQEVITHFKQLVKSKYMSGVPMDLNEALRTYCTFVGRNPSKDELSRVRNVAKDLNEPYLHELTSEHFSTYENNLVKSAMGIRTIEERIALIKRIYETLIQKRTYLDGNPLSYWKPSVSSKVRKAKAAAGIASIERVCTVFGSHEFALFGQTHRAFYLVMITAVVTGMRITSICRLKAADLMFSLEDAPIIDIEMDKTLAGKRQIPIPARLHIALKDYLRAHGKFPIADRGKDKGCSDAISKLYKEFVEQYPQFDLFGLNPHGLRASLNNHLHKINVPQNMCCALLGHKDNHVNSIFYAEPTETDLLELNIKGVQEKLLKTLKFDQHLMEMEGEVTN
jgi:integrase